MKVLKKKKQKAWDWSMRRKAIIQTVREEGSEVQGGRKNKNWTIIDLKGTVGAGRGQILGIER